MMQSFTLSACKALYLLFVKDYSVDLLVTGGESPGFFAVLRHELAQKLRFLLAVIADNPDLPEGDDAGVMQCRIAVSTTALLHGANLGRFDAKTRVPVQGSQEVSVVTAGVHEQRFTSFLNGNASMDKPIGILCGVTDSRNCLAGRCGVLAARPTMPERNFIKQASDLWDPSPYSASAYGVVNRLIRFEIQQHAIFSGAHSS
jgi:hypothetical protein